MKAINFWTALLCGLLLFSCSKEEPVDDSTKPGPPATIEVKLSGDISSKATLPVATDESKIAKGIVFVFRGTGINPVIDGRASFDFSAATVNPVVVNITAGASRHVYVVANIADDADFSGVAKVSDLYNLTNKYQLTAMRTGTNLAMSGSTLNVNATAATPSSPVSATVQLYFLGSQVHIDWDLSQVPANLTGLSITGAYLLNVKSKSDYFSAPATYLTINTHDYLRGKSDIGTFTGSYLPGALMTNTYDIALKMSDLAADKGFTANSFYVLENNSSAPTIVALEGNYGGAVYYYPIVINGDQNGSGAGATVNPGNKSSVVARSNQYYVKAIIKGLGNTDPYEPLVKGAINVTVVAASWNPVLNIDQEFN